MANRGEILKCETCGKKFSSNSSSHTYCSKKCRPSVINKSHNNYYGDYNSTRGNTGSASELIIVGDLMLKGYYVFRHDGVNSPFDIVIYSNGKFKRVEVKSARRNVNTENIAYAKPKNNEYDVLAIYNISDNEIIYLNKNGKEIEL